MQKLWQSFEYYLLRRFPKASTLATPFNDPIAESIDEYQAFSNTWLLFFLHKAHLEREYDIMLEVCKQFHLRPA